MASELYNIIEGVSREKGIDPQIVVSAVEDAIVVATRKYYKTQENLRAVLDKDSGKINAYAVKSIVETPEQVEDPNLQVTVEQARKLDPSAEAGGELLIPKVTEGILGRIAAQLAKQVIFQKVREAERDTVYNEYIGHVNEIVNATVKRLEGPDVILDIGKAEARMGRKEQSRLESFAVGERIRVVIVRVEKAVKGPGVIASRSAPELVQHLFQTEVPEIYDGTVVIRAIAREAGERTKIAVMSKDKDVDAVGACVGMKGMRVQSIIRELRGEKIDIIEYHEDRGYVRGKGAAAGESEPRDDCGCDGQASGSGGGRHAAFARDREKRAERAPGGEAAGLEDRHQERRRKAAGSGTADVGAGHADRNSAGNCYRTGRRAGRETEGCGREYGGIAGRYDAGATGSD